MSKDKKVKTKQDKADSKEVLNIRQLAEKIVAGKKNSGVKNLTLEALETLIHELSVHQIELEIQNEELKSAGSETEAALNKYTDLYDFSPVAYFTFDKYGIIEEANLTGTCLLGAESQFLIQRRFRTFVEKSYQETFFHFLYKIFASGNKHSCELLLVNKQGKSFYSDIVGSPVKDRNGKVIYCRVAVTDISERKKAEAIIRSSVEEKEKTQEEERKRISEVLHNNLGQLLYGIKLKLEKLGKTYSNELLAECKCLLTDAIRETKKIAFEIVPALLENSGLGKAIEELAKKYSNTHLTIHSNIFGYEKKLPSSLEIAVFRIVQEFLNNIAKHSQATEAQIYILITTGKIILKIEDNGIGFNDKEITNGFGLKNIHYRVQLLNAWIDIDSTPGKGTSVSLVIPFKG